MSPNLPTSSQAEAMIRRVSPEGRARAQRDRERRQRLARQRAGKMALAAVVIALAAWGIDVAIMPIGMIGVVIALLLFAMACIAIGIMSRERPAAAVDLSHAKLDQLPARTEIWLEQQRPLLPDAASSLLDSISRRLGDMTPQLERLDLREPGADAVQRLLGSDLPALVRGYQEVPAGLRSHPGSVGRSADAHLLHGLGVIDSEIGRMTEQLARGAFDELATHDRFLELKYEDVGRLE